MDHDGNAGNAAAEQMMGDKKRINANSGYNRTYQGSNIGNRVFVHKNLLWKREYSRYQFTVLYCQVILKQV